MPGGSEYREWHRRTVPGSDDCDDQIILKIIGNRPTCCQSKTCNYLYDALSKSFAAALGSNEVGRVTLPADRPRDTPCYQGDCDTQILYLRSSYFVFIKIITFHIYRFLSYLAFPQLHWMRQTFNNKNQKTYDEYRQGCR